MAQQWPSDPSRTDIPHQTSFASGIDCVCILLRHILSLDDYKIDVFAGPLNFLMDPHQYKQVVDFILSDFDAPLDPSQAVEDVIARTRNAALAQMQGSMNRNQDKQSFAALINSDAMIDLLWANPDFRFYDSKWKMRGYHGNAEKWVQIVDFEVQDKAQWSQLAWDFQDGDDTLQKFISRSEISHKEGEILMIRTPEIFQVSLTVPSREVAYLKLQDMSSCTAKILNTSDEDFEPCTDLRTEGMHPNMRWEVGRFGPATPQPYCLIAAVMLREDPQDKDAIRLWSLMGDEVEPRSRRRPSPRPIPTWGFSVDSFLPEGRQFMLFYKKTRAIPLDGINDAPNFSDRARLNEIMARSLNIHPDQPPTPGHHAWTDFELFFGERDREAWLVRRKQWGVQPAAVSPQSDVAVGSPQVNPQ